MNAAEGVADGDGHFGPCARRADGAGDAKGGLRPRGAATAAAGDRYPFAWQLSGGQTRAFKTAKFTKVLKVMRLLKLSKILKGSRYLEAFEDWFSMQRCAHRCPSDRRVCARAYRGACVRALIVARVCARL